ncbi:MAG: tetratricopeptide repeat protein, partial [Nostoc sp.]
MGLLLFKYRIAGLVSLTLLVVSISSPSLSLSPPVASKLAQSHAKTAIDWLNQGLQAIQAGKVQDAIAAFKKAA